MKNAIFIVIFVLSAALLLADTFLGFGVEFPGNHEWSFSGESADLDSDAGVNVFAELLFKNPGVKQEPVNLGLGIAWFSPRGIDLGEDEDDYEETFTFIPIYLLGKINLIMQEQNALYCKGKFGYSFFSGNEDYCGEFNTEGGLFTGLSGGYEFKKAFFEIAYNISRGVIDLDSRDSSDWEVTQSNLAFMVGFKVN